MGPHRATFLRGLHQLLPLLRRQMEGPADEKRALPFQAIPSREKRLRPFYRHHKRLRVRRDEHHPHPEGDRAGARRDGHQQACEASEDGQPARPADNDDGVRLQGDGRGLPHEGDVQGPGRCPKVSRRRACRLVHEHRLRVIRLQISCEDVRQLGVIIHNGMRQKTFGFCGAGLRKRSCPSFLS